MCARAGARVTVAPKRQAALDLALDVADVAILDGVHQTAPRRASVAFLAVDPEAPFGVGACPPRGDMRASRDELEALADLVVPVRALSRGAFVDGCLVPWRDLARLRVGLVTALARPERVVRLLFSHNVLPRTIRTFPDHARASIPDVGGIDLWLATPKCAVWLAGEAAILEHVPLVDFLGLHVLRDLLDPATSRSYPRKDR
jgi:tetraacyldisaccharide-1-P 4'-kinase